MPQKIERLMIYGRRQTVKMSLQGCHLKLEVLKEVREGNQQRNH
jgi:hypothetical protein